jgi:hypothetical protein
LSIRRISEIAAFCVALLIAILAFCAWITSRDEQRRLQTTLTAQKQIINAAGVRERARDASLKGALVQIDKLKRDTLTPSQIIHDLPKYLPLPQPITLADAPNLSETATHHGMDASEKGSTLQVTALSPQGSPPAAPEAQVPAADLKPLYDFVQDYRACQLRLTAANQNAVDQTSEVAALTRERDVAIAASKGGSFWRRLRGNALWFAIGAGVGYAAVKR